LRPRRAEALAGGPGGFNPTLVRLRLGALQAVGVLMAMFQSHAGSIEAG